MSTVPSNCHILSASHFWFGFTEVAPLSPLTLSLFICCFLGSFMTILMQFSKIKCIFYDSFRESAPLGAERESKAAQCRPVSLYDCLSFLLSIMSVFAFIFALIFISFICSSSASSSTLLFVRSACVSKFIFLFVSTVNLMCLWHVLTVSSWRGYRRGYWRFMLTFFFIISHIHHSVGLFSSHTCVWVSAHLPYSCSPCMTLIEKPTALHTLHWPTKNEQQKFDVCCYGKSED